MAKPIPTPISARATENKAMAGIWSFLSFQYVIWLP